MRWWLIPIALYLVMSLVTLAAYGVDKRAARLGRRRIPERTLHLLELLGGWPGALLGMRVVRHKGNKTSYVIVFWLIVLLHAAGWGFFLWARHTQG